MTTGGLNNDDRNWPHRSAPQRTAPHRIYVAAVREACINEWMERSQLNT
jgi:hypothetical protein